MTSMIDGVRMDRMAKEFAAQAAIAADNAKHAAHSSVFWACLGCGKSIRHDDLCSDCLRLVADTLRDAAGRADK